MKAKGLIIGAALALALSVPVKADPIFDHSTGIGLDASGTAFMDALYEGYVALSLDCDYGCMDHLYKRLVFRLLDA